VSELLAKEYAERIHAYYARPLRLADLLPPSAPPSRWRRLCNMLHFFRVRLRAAWAAFKDPYHWDG
jgi:hypothetical protein